MANSPSRDLSTILTAQQHNETLEIEDLSLVPSQNVSPQLYVYRSLQIDEIRHSEAENRNGQITYHLEHVSLDTAPNFTALSYCWGDPTPNQTFTCDNFSLPITDSVKVTEEWENLFMD